MELHDLKAESLKQRLLSLDVLRGLIMILLAAKSCLIFSALKKVDVNNDFSVIIGQFSHHEWNGLTFWDLVQPGFMLMAGSAMYISYHFKLKNGVTWAQNFRHILIRSSRLFALGLALHCVSHGSLVWELWNVLVQLAITSIIAYFIINKSYAWQIFFSLFLLVLTEALYRLILVPGYDQPFVIGQNFGSYIDMVLMGKVNSGGWVAINFIPTTAHTIWGVLAGKLLISSINQYDKVKTLILYGLVALFLGYFLDYLQVTPIVKRISTSSFTLSSGGWILLMLAFLYWLNDIKGFKKYVSIFTVIGMNSIFIYLFFESVGRQWFNDFIGIYVMGFAEMLFIPESYGFLLATIVTLVAEWYICYWFYKRKIFFKL